MCNMKEKFKLFFLISRALSQPGQFTRGRIITILDKTLLQKIKHICFTAFDLLLHTGSQFFSSDLSGFILRIWIKEYNMNKPGAECTSSVGTIFFPRLLALGSAGLPNRFEEVQLTPELGSEWAGLLLFRHQFNSFPYSFQRGIIGPITANGGITSP